MSTFTASTTTVGTLDPWKRVRYSLGLVLGEAEFQQDQLYLTERDERHARALHGTGVVSGLSVAFDPDEREVTVSPGLAVDGHGRWVCVPGPQCVGVDGLAAWLAGQESPTPNEDGTVSVWVTLCHLPCATDLIPIPSGPCKTADESMTASRVADSFLLDLSLSRPAPVGELAADDLGELLDVLTAGAEDGETGPDPVRRLRRRLSRWSADRPTHPEVVSSCLDADGCLALAELRVPVSADGSLDPAGEVAVDRLVRPDLVSTGLLTEWLLHLSARQTDPELALDDLADVDVAGANRGQVLTRARRGWVARDIPGGGGGGGTTGPAGGDLRGDYPDPQVQGLLGVPVKEDLPADRRRALGWDPFTGVWQPQSFVHAPAGPYAVVAAADFPAFEEVRPEEFGPYNLKVEYLAQPLSYNLVFAGYEPPDQVRYVVKGDVVLNADDQQLKRFFELLRPRSRQTLLAKPVEFVVVRFQSATVRVQLASNVQFPDNQGTLTADLLRELFPDLRVQVEISAHRSIQQLVGTATRAEER